MQENLKKKYGITNERLKEAIDQIPLGKIFCDSNVLAALVDLLANGDIQAPTEQTMREFIKEHLDEILDKFFQKNIFCCICERKEKCATAELEECVLIPCEVNANLPKENGKKFLDCTATPENIAKLKEIYEELVTR